MQTVTEKLPETAVVPRTRRETIWLVFGVAVAVLCLYTFSVLANLRIGAPEGVRIFGSFWASGWAAAHQLNPYAAYPLTYTPGTPPHAKPVLDLNLNPPTLLPLFEALSWFRPDDVVKIWTLLSVALYIGSAFLLVRKYEPQIQHRQVIWLLLSWPVLNTLRIGQLYGLITALAVVAWILLEDNRQIAAGICIGILIACKPNYALWAVLLIFCRRERAAATAAVVSAGLACVPLILYGPGIYLEWIHAIKVDPHWAFTVDISISGFAARLGHRRVGEATSVLLLLFTLVFVIWKRPSLRNTTGIALSVAMLASPLAWMHYALLLAGPLVRKRWNWLITAAMLFLMPPFSSAFFFLPICIVAAYFFTEAAIEDRPAAPLPA